MPIKMTITSEDDCDFNHHVQRILEATYDNMPMDPEDVAACLRLIWKNLGGTITPTWRERKEAEAKAKGDD